MCRWCGRSELADRLTAGLAPTRPEFLAYAASFAVAASSISSARADDPAEVIFRNGAIYPMAKAGGNNIEALTIGGGLTEADVHLGPPRLLFKLTEPPLNKKQISDRKDFFLQSGLRK